MYLLLDSGFQSNNHIYHCRISTALKTAGTLWSQERRLTLIVASATSTSSSSTKGYKDAHTAPLCSPYVVIQHAYIKASVRINEEMCTHETSLMSKRTQEKGSGLNKSEVNNTILKYEKQVLLRGHRNMALINVTGSNGHVLRSLTERRDPERWSQCLCQLLWDPAAVCPGLHLQAAGQTPSPPPPLQGQSICLQRCTEVYIP